MAPIDPNDNKILFKFNGERIGLILGGTLIGALAIWFGLKMATPLVKKACQSILEAPDKSSRSEKVVSIEAIVVKPGTISRRITTVGKLRANESVTIKAEIHGRIKEIAFKEGTQVKKGDVLIRFDDEELQAEVVKSEAEVEYRQVKHDRQLAYQSKGVVRGADFESERGQLNMAKAQLDVNKAKLAKAVIYAPFEGKIGLIDVSVGAIVDTQKELVTLVDFDPMKIDFKIAEKYIHDIGVGQTAEVKLDSIPDQIFQSTVEAIDSRVDPQTHSIAVRASIPNEDGKLQAGLFGSVGVIVGVKNNALLVPESALGREGDIEYVWVVVNGKTSRKRVLTGTREGGQVEITAGLRPDEIVVTSGQLKLGEGSGVKISNMGGGDVEVTDEEDIIENKDSPAPPKDSAAKATKEEPAKETTVKAEPSKEAASKEEPVKPEPTQETAPKEEPTKVEPAKDEAPREEAEKTPLTPPAPQTSISNGEKTGEEPAKAPNSSETTSLEKSSENESTETPKTNSDKPKEHKLEGRQTSSSVKSFFGKTRDFVVNKFKGS